MTRWLLLLVLAGCASPESTPVPIVLGPVTPLRERPVVPPPIVARTTQATTRVLDDTAATQARAACFVASPTTPVTAINRTTALTAAANKATARLRAHKSRQGYPPADIAAARSAADALASQLPAHPSCPPPEPPP